MSPQRPEVGSLWRNKLSGRVSRVAYVRPFGDEWFVVVQTLPATPHPPRNGMVLSHFVKRYFPVAASSGIAAVTR